jgi:hypothetical protein
MQQPSLFCPTYESRDAIYLTPSRMYFLCMICNSFHVKRAGTASQPATECYTRRRAYRPS